MVTWLATPSAALAFHVDLKVMRTRVKVEQRRLADRRSSELTLHAVALAIQGQVLATAVFHQLAWWVATYFIRTSFIDKSGLNGVNNQYKISQITECLIYLIC